LGFQKVNLVVLCAHSLRQMFIPIIFCCSGVSGVRAAQSEDAIERNKIIGIVLLI